MAEQKPPRRNTETGRQPTKAARSQTARRDSRASALHDAITHAVGEERDFKKKSSLGNGSGRQNGLLALTALMAAFTLYAWFGRPAFIWGPPIEPPPPAVQDANVRMAMFLMGMRIDKYKKANRAYPASLSELGDTVKGINYERLNDSTFELRGKAANHEVVFRNDMRADEFLGNTKEVIQSRRKR